MPTFSFSFHSISAIHAFTDSKHAMVSFKADRNWFCVADVSRMSSAYIMVGNGVMPD